MFSEDDFRTYAKLRKAEDRHFRYGRSIRRYIRENRDLMEMSGWIEWAYDESRKPFVYGGPLPAWTPEQWREMAAEWEGRKVKKT